MSSLRKCFARLVEVQATGGGKGVTGDSVRRHCFRNVSFTAGVPPTQNLSSQASQQLPGRRLGSNSAINSGASSQPCCSSLSLVHSNGYSTQVPSLPSAKTSDLQKLKATARTLATSQKYVEAYKRNMDSSKLLTKEEYAEFSTVFPDLVRDIVTDLELRDMPETNEWVEKLLNYNVPHGKQNRALLCASAYRYLTKDLTEENIRLSYIVGWCVEILQAFFVVMDDIMDDSPTRRGSPCWYRLKNVGLIAINDGIILENCIYRLLKKHFSAKPYYADLMELFHDVSLKTAYGQSLDTRTGVEKQFDTYTFELYSSIVKYKTSYYTFTLPVSLAMVMAGIKDPELFEQAEAITLEMGHFFQVQDDYLDAFGDAKVTGKIGTDIQDGKCSWLVVTALQQATPEQRQMLLENYGVNDPDKIAKVKECYADMRMPDLYSAYEEQTYNLIVSHMQHLSPGLPKKLFEDMLSTIYRRSS